jgi:hypothetical protein
VTRAMHCAFLCIVVLGLTCTEAASAAVISPPKPATLEVLEQWRTDLKANGPEEAIEHIASSEYAYPKVHTHAFYGRRATEATPPALMALGLTEELTAAMPLLREHLRPRPIGDLKKAASAAAQATEKILAGGGYGNLVLALAIVGTVRPVLMERLIADPTLAPAIESLLRTTLRELATPEDFLRLSAEELGRPAKAIDPVVLRGPRITALNGVIEALTGVKNKSIAETVMSGECDMNPANQLKVPDVSPVALWLLSTAFEFDLSEGFFQLINAEKVWPNTEKGFREAVEKDIAAVREKRVKPLTSNGETYTAQDFVKFFRLTWRSGRAPAFFEYPAGSPGAAARLPAPRPGPWPDSDETPRLPAKSPVSNAPAKR